MSKVINLYLSMNKWALDEAVKQREQKQARPTQGAVQTPLRVNQQIERIREKDQREQDERRENRNRYRYHAGSYVDKDREFSYYGTLDAIQDVQPFYPSFQNSAKFSPESKHTPVGKQLGRGKIEYSLKRKYNIEAKEQLLTMSKIENPLQSYRQSVFEQQLYKSLNGSK